MSVVHIPTPLRPYTGEQARVEVAGATVGEVLEALLARHSGLAQHLRDDRGRLRSFVNIYVGEEDIRFLEQEATVVGAESEITIVPSIAGGAA